MQPHMGLIEQNTTRGPRSQEHVQARSSTTLSSHPHEVLPSQVAPRCSQVLLTGGSQVLLTGGFQIVLKDTMNFAAAVLRSEPCPSKTHKVPKQVRDGGRVEPGPINPRAALKSRLHSHLEQLFSLGRQAQRCLGLCYRSHMG